MRCRVAVIICILIGSSASAFGAGEAINGYPSWAERVIHEWTNRARVDPQFEMAACGAACGEAACYSPIPPVGWNESLNRAARFHADHMARNHYFAHNSACVLTTDINTSYPQLCDGSASCSCVGGVLTGSTAWNTRVARFGKSPTAEVIASPSDPNWAFYLWLYESSASTTCAFSNLNGHRWSILKQTGVVGPGVGVGNSVMDFGSGITPTKIVSAVHYPKQAPTVELWANWYDPAGSPRAATAVVDGVTRNMTLTRGTGENGAWMATASGVGSGCHRYYFQFTDSAGTIQRYPTNGTYGIGDNSCADWSSGGDMSVNADFDGDGRTDKAVFRPSTRDWLILRSSGGSTVSNWGLTGDIPVAADYDGDGKSDIAVWRPSDGTWWVLRSTGGYINAGWGYSTDIPVPGDYDGDGKADFAVFRPSNGSWWILRSSGGHVVQFWGYATDRPVQADYDGDGKTDVAVWRPSDGTWWVLQSTGGYTTAGWGYPDDVPIPGRYDTDGRADFAIFRPSTREFWVLLSRGGFTRQAWGYAGDLPVGGDFNGDDRDDYTIWRPSTRDWWVMNSSDGSSSVTNWGQPGDTPITEARER